MPDRNAPCRVVAQSLSTNVIGYLLYSIPATNTAIAPTGMSKPPAFSYNHRNRRARAREISVQLQILQCEKVEQVGRGITLPEGNRAKEKRAQLGTNSAYALSLCFCFSFPYSSLLGYLASSVASELTHRCRASCDEVITYETRHRERRGLGGRSTQGRAQAPYGPAVELNMPRANPGMCVCYTLHRTPARNQSIPRARAEAIIAPPCNSRLLPSPFLLSSFLLTRSPSHCLGRLPAWHVTVVWLKAHPRLFFKEANRL